MQRWEIDNEMANIEEDITCIKVKTLLGTPYQEIRPLLLAAEIRLHLVALETELLHWREMEDTFDFAFIGENCENF